MVDLCRPRKGQEIRVNDHVIEFIYYVALHTRVIIQAQEASSKNQDTEFSWFLSMGRRKYIYIASGFRISQAESKTPYSHAPEKYNDKHAPKKHSFESYARENDVSQNVDPPPAVHLKSLPYAASHDR